ncbi:MAG: TonB-dependent receptor, partial [Candidatus Hydrogenedentes bacterium]|nr:TonB-dependent receptor [Candidatus Hydrogenedentota bacterium]
PLGDLGFYRFYLGYSNYDEAEYQSGKSANDAWDSTFGGFRIDLTPDESDTVTIEGRASGNDTSETLDLPTRTFPFRRRTDGSEDLARRSLVARWNRDLANDSRIQLQAYYDYFESDATNILQREHTVDLDFQYEFSAGERHRIVWGAGFRYVSDDIRGTNLLSLDPDERDLKIFSAYLQDEITVIPDTLSLTLGAKLEHNSYSGVEIQPNARLTWTPADRHTVWLAASRAVRSPSRAELDVRLENTTTRRLAVALYGDEDFESENVLALEAGYRVQLHETAALDLALFHNSYDDLRTTEFRRPFIEVDPLPVHLAIPVVADNNMSGTAYGFEAALDWRPREWWRVRTGYSYLEMDLSPNPDTIDLLSGTVEDESPEQQFFMHHSFDLPRNVEIDATFRYVDAIPALGVDDYLTMDIRLAWLPRENLEFSLVGQNLFEDSHLEYAPSFINTVPSEVERGIYGKVSWRF